MIRRRRRARPPALERITIEGLPFLLNATSRELTCPEHGRRRAADCLSCVYLDDPELAEDVARELVAAS